jgi:hypothetical protein
MAKNGIVVMVLYAQYFNNQTDECTTEDWRLMPNLKTSLPLTKERRTVFNDLVQDTNTVIKRVVGEVVANAKNMKLVTADWSLWASANKGLFCKLYFEVYFSYQNKTEDVY